MQTFNIPANPAINPTGTPIVRAGSQAALIRNADPTSAIFLSFINSIDATTLSNAIMLNAGGVVVVDGTRDVYATTSAISGFTPVQVIEGGISFFQPASSLRLTDPSGTDFILLTTGHPPMIEIGTGDIAESQPGEIISGTLGSGPSRQLAIELLGNKVVGQPAFANTTVLLLSGSPDLVTHPPSVQISASDGTTSCGISTLPTRNEIFNGTFNGDSPVTANDSTPLTATAATFTRITKNWTIPGGNSQTATTWRLSARFAGAQGSTAETLMFNITAFGVSIAQVGFPSTFCAISTGFVGRIVGEVQVNTPGSVATITASFEVSIRQSGSSTESVLTGEQQSTTANTAINEDMFFNAEWGATTGAPTLTCSGSTIERLGQ